jgi:hypothetical protein
VIDMPLNAIPPTTTVDNLNEKIEASKGQCKVDVGFWGGVIPGNEVSACLLCDSTDRPDRKAGARELGRAQRALRSGAPSGRRWTRREGENGR